ncbi:MAG: hypothetical protein U1F25_16120 [Rubrivivax sp.]
MNVAEATLESASPPRKRPTSALAKSSRRPVMPPLFIRSPASRKNGIASSNRLSTPPTTCCGIAISGMSPSQAIVAAPASIRLNATGSASSRQTTRIAVRKSARPSELRRCRASEDALAFVDGLRREWSPSSRASRTITTMSTPPAGSAA